MKKILHYVRDDMMHIKNILINKTQEHMQKAMQEMFNDFDKNFYTFPAIQPVIVVPENNIKEKTKK